MPLKYLKFITLAAVVSLIVACSGGESRVTQGNREGILHYSNSTEPQGLDPHVVTGVPENHIIRALFEGLAVKNPYTLEPEPGVAERWDFSDDGRVITFHIREDARWSNGDPVTAEDYVWSWRRALNPAMGNQNAYMLFPVKNAEAFSTGKLDDPEQLGVKALDARTLEVTLNEPTPYFLQLMDHYSSFAVHRATIEKFGKATDRFTRWTRAENIVGNGAFRLKDWQLNRRITIEKSDTYWDADTVKLNGVVYYPVENIVSEERMFRVGQLHFTQEVPLDKIEGYKAMENSPFVQAPYLGTYYYLLNIHQAPVDDPRVRHALAMAIDRDTLVSTVLKGAYVAAYAITPPGTLGYQPPKVFDYDVAGARKLLAEAGYPDGKGWPGIEIKYNTSENHRKIAVALQQMWKDNLNIDVTISNQEWKVYLDSVDQMDFQVARRGWIGDYVDPNNFLDLFLGAGGNNNTGFANARFDDMILNQAPKAATKEQRFAIFHEAEKLMMEQMPIIPIYTYTSKHLIHPSVKGLPSNLMDSLNLKYVWLEPEPEASE
ncbi:MAG: peptide ABC transporter substrate-binding protein [Halioglobus sp.]